MTNINLQTMSDTIYNKNVSANIRKLASYASSYDDIIAGILSAKYLDILPPKTANYIALIGDLNTHIPFDTLGGAYSCQLLDSTLLNLGSWFEISDLTGHAPTNNLTITLTNSTDRINGATTHVITNAYGVRRVTLIAANTWIITGGKF